MAAGDLGERPSARCAPIERRRRPTCDAPRVAVVRERVQVAARGAPEQQHERGLGQRARPGRPSRCPRAWSLRAVTGPTPQSRSTGSGCRNASSPSGGTTSRPSGLATPLATLARNFVRATPTVIGSPTCVEHVAPQPHGDLARRARDSAACRARRGTPRRSTGPRRRASCRRRPGTSPCSPRCRPTKRGLDHDRLRAQPARLRAAHRRADAVRLGLVARREHDPRADDHRPAAQARVVPLLDRREERVDVGVQDGRLACARTYVRILHAPPASSRQAGW